MDKKRSFSAKVLLRYIMIVAEAGNNDTIDADMFDLMLMGLEVKIDRAIERGRIDKSIKEKLIDAIVSYDKETIEILL